MERKRNNSVFLAKDKKMNLNIKRTDIAILGIILSFFTAEGIWGELLFWLLFVYLFMKSRKYKQNVEETTFWIIIIGYSLAFFVQFSLNFQSIAWFMRLYGLTKNLMMFSLLMLLWSILSQTTAYLCQVFGTIFSFIYVIRPDVIEKFASQNGVVGLYIIILPFSFYRVLYQKSYISYISISLLVPLLMIIDSDTFKLILLVEVVGLVIYLLSTRWRIIQSKLLFKVILKGSLCILIIFMFKMITDANFYQTILVIMQKVNQDRAWIWNNGFAQFNERSMFQKFFGGGDNHVQMQFIQHAGHNAILEELLIYGYFGLVLFTLESFSLLKKLKKIANKRELYILVIISIGTYLEFMVHPFYSTYFIIKVVYLAIIKAMFDSSLEGKTKYDKD